MPVISVDAIFSKYFLFVLVDYVTYNSWKANWTIENRQQGTRKESALFCEACVLLGHHTKCEVHVTGLEGLLYMTESWQLTMIRRPGSENLHRLLSHRSHMCNPRAAVQDAECTSLISDCKDVWSRSVWELQDTPAAWEGPRAPQPQPHLSVSALLWVSRAACRSFSSRFRAISSCSTSPWVHFRGLMKRISFSNSSFSLMRISRSLSESSTPGQASLSSLASWIFRLAILGAER